MNQLRGMTERQTQWELSGETGERTDVGSGRSV